MAEALRPKPAKPIPARQRRRQPAGSEFGGAYSNACSEADSSDGEASRQICKIPNADAFVLAIEEVFPERHQGLGTTVQSKLRERLALPLVDQSLKVAKRQKRRVNNQETGILALYGQIALDMLSNPCRDTRPARPIRSSSPR